MKRILYHGSVSIIEKPVYGKGNIHNDYGIGFYCCTNLELSKEWASRKNGFGYVNKYTLRDDNLKILDLTKEDVFVWIALLIKNRTLKEEISTLYKREIDYLLNNYLIDISKYDVVIGYRADDAYFRFPESFIRSEITIESMRKIFMAGELGKQYVLVSKKSFSLLKYVESIETIKEHKDNYFKRKDKADKLYKELIVTDRYALGKRLIDLVRENG